MNLEDRMELFFKYRDIAYKIAQDYISSSNDLDTVTDYAIDGLMRAVNSIESQEQLDNMDFKTYAEFYMKSEINKRIGEK